MGTMGGHSDTALNNLEEPFKFFGSWGKLVRWLAMPEEISEEVWL